MTDAKKCDICFGYYDKTDSARNISVVLGGDSPLDTCQGCYTKLEAFVSGKKVSKQKKHHWSKEARERAAARMKKRQAEGKMKRSGWSEERRKKMEEFWAHNKGKGRRHMKNYVDLKSENEYMQKVQKELHREKEQKKCTYCFEFIDGDDDLCKSCKKNMEKTEKNED